MTVKCLLCNGSGQLKLLLRKDEEDGKLYSSETEVNDQWLAELKAYCLDKRNKVVPTAYVLRLVDEIWQLTAIAIQTAKENQELKRGNTKTLS